MNRLATLALLSVPLCAQPPTEIRVPFYGKELVYQYAVTAAAGSAPALVVTGGGWDYWAKAAEARGWGVISPVNIAPAASDAYAKALETIVRDAAGRIRLDPRRVYLVGTGPGVAAVFFARGRVPHLWAAAFAAFGDVKPAIDSNRLFTANAELVPLLWAGRPEDELLREKLRVAGYPVEWREASQLNPGSALDFLAGNAASAAPPRVDCETGNLAFGRCYWIEITKADAARRNDVLPRSLVAPGSGAYLALGGFGYDAAAPGPGIVVAWLPENYTGPLKMQDRIVSVAGAKIADGRAYARFMDEAREERPAAILVERGKERHRIETRILLPKREENVTARVRGEWLAESREVLIVSRGVAELKLDLPAAWAPAAINWNGQEVLNAAAAGCWIVGDATRRCPD